MARAQESGKEFEVVIGNLYELLGYRVTRDAYVAGQQIDLICEKFIPGIGQIKLAVECKYRKSGSVPNQEVQNFVYSFNAIRSVGFTSGVIVSNQRFGPAAKNVADAEPLISLHTQSEIESQLLDIREVASAAIRNYDDSEITSHYISLSATGHFPGGNYSKIDNIGESLLRWMGTTKSGLITIFADYGGGKTTLLNRLKRDLLQKFVSGSGERCPVFLPLKEFYKYDNLDVFVHHCLLSDFNVSLPAAIFWRFAKQSKLSLLLDGFDEISTQADLSIRAERFLKISPLLTTNSPAILTCRPSYFTSTAEYNDIISAANAGGAPSINIRPSSNQALARKNLYETISKRLHAKFTDKMAYAEIKEWSVGEFKINLLDTDNIDKYLMSFDVSFETHCGCSWRDVRAFLDNVYDLSDLMKRPLLLSMIVETILAGHIDISQTGTVLGPSALYEIYTETQLQWNWSKGETRQLLPTELRREFSELAAVAMLSANTLKITYGQISSVCAPFFQSGNLEKLKKNGPLSLDAVANDVQCCSFLKRSDDDLFQFVHKSFMEFFVARYVKNNIDTHGKHILETYALGSEILYFIGNFALVENEVASSLVKLLSESKNRNKSLLKRNVMGALLFCGESLYGKKIEHSDVSNLLVRRQRYWNIRLHNINFTNTNFESCTFEMGELQGSFLKSKIKDSTFSSVKTSLNASGSSVEHCRIVSGSLSINGAGKIYDCDIENAEFEVRGSTEINSCRFSNTRTLISVGDELLRIDDSIFEGGSVVISCSGPSYPFLTRRTEFFGTTILGLRCSIKDLGSMMEKKNGSRFAAFLSNCRGIAFITSGDVIVPKDKLQARAWDMFKSSDDLSEKEADALKSLWAGSSTKSMWNFLLIDEEAFRRSGTYRDIVRNRCVGIDPLSSTFFPSNEAHFEVV